MTSDEERCAEHERFKRIDAAFRAGDLAALRAVEDPDAVPNGPMPLAIGPCLEYAIYAPAGTPWHWRGCNRPFNLVRLGPRGPKRP